jgi:hypothetical protein
VQLQSISISSNRTHVIGAMIIDTNAPMYCMCMYIHTRAADIRWTRWVFLFVEFQSVENKILDIKNVQMYIFHYLPYLNLT